MWSYASTARSSGYSSIIGRTLASALNASVSVESWAVPDGQPCTEARFMIICTVGTCTGYTDTPTMISLPLRPRP